MTAEQVGRWFTHEPPAVADVALGQFEQLLRSVAEHRGSVQADEWDGCFNAIWQTPFDCLTYFAEWRRAMAEAVSHLADPLFFSPAWLTEPVVALTAAVAAGRAFDRLPVLADALEEAGCDNRLVLDHLRANDDHAHHCWAVDVLRVGGGNEL